MEILNTQQAIELIGKEAKSKGLEVEAIVSEGKKFSTSFQQSHLDKYDFSNTRSLGIRLIANGKEGVSYTESFTKNDISNCIDEAKENSLFVEKNYDPAFVSTATIKSMPELFNPALQSVNVERKVALAKDFEQLARAKDARITSLPYNAYSDFESGFTVFNSNGVNASYKSNGCYIYGYGLAKEGSQTAMSWAVQVGRDFETLNAQEVANEVADKTLQKLAFQTPTTGNYPVIFSEDAASTLLGLITSHFSAKSVLEKTSLFTDKLGKQVFSDIVTIYDDPFNKEAFGSRPFDDEGSPSQKTLLVEKGVLKNYLSNSVIAKKMNLPNTANASRSSQSNLGIGTSNFVFGLGSENFNSLVGKHPQTIVIDNIKGTAGYNGISGNFSLQVEGHLYKNGHYQSALANFVVSGNVLDLAKKIIGLSDQYYKSFSTILCPDILVESLSIAGK